MRRPLIACLLGAAVAGCSASGPRLADPSAGPAASSRQPSAPLSPPASRTATPTPAPTRTSAPATTNPAPTTAAPASPPPRPPSPPPTVVLLPPSRPQPPPVPAGRHVFPVQGCTASYARSHHDYPATDIFAARGCVVVSPVSGRVDEVSSLDRWNASTNRGADRGGLTFAVVGDDGVRYYGSHLSRLDVRAGQRVRAGQQVGEIGNTGDARGIATHLHFGLSWPTRPAIWWVRRGEVFPWPYLDNWRAGGNRSPAAVVSVAHRRLGDEPRCAIDC